jgi:linoleoyl-CoA desaturase
MTRIWVNGILRDVSQFKHPGGQELLRLGTALNDATVLFYTHHPHNSTAEKVLNSLPLIGMTIYDGSNLTSLKATRQKIQVPNRPCTLISWAISNTLLFGLGFALLLNGYFWLPIMTFTAFSIHMGFTFYHYINHGGAYKKHPVLARLLSLFMNSATYHEEDWRDDHNIKHHLDVNDPNRDNDVSSGVPFIRLHEDQKLHPWHKYQIYYMWLLFALYGIAVVFKGKFTKTRILYPITDLVLYCLIPTIYHNYYWGVVFYVILKMLTGLLFLTIFITSHNNMHCYNNRKNPEPDWLLNELKQTVNWGGTFACWFFGGINYQIEHHVFPAIDPMNYPMVAQIMRNNYPRNYVHYPSFWTAFTETLKYIRFIGKTEK